MEFKAYNPHTDCKMKDCGTPKDTYFITGRVIFSFLLSQCVTVFIHRTGLTLSEATSVFGRFMSALTKEEYKQRVRQNILKQRVGYWDFEGAEIRLVESDPF